MHLWLVSRTDNHFDYHEHRTVLVRAKTEADALSLVCGGPDPEFPDVKAFASWPMQGFEPDRSNASATLLSPEGPAEILLSG